MAAIREKVHYRCCGRVPAFASGLPEPARRRIGRIDQLVEQRRLAHTGLPHKHADTLGQRAFEFPDTRARGR